MHESFLLNIEICWIDSTFNINILSNMHRGKQICQITNLPKVRNTIPNRYYNHNRNLFFIIYSQSQRYNTIELWTPHWNWWLNLNIFKTPNPEKRRMGRYGCNKIENENFMNCGGPISCQNDSQGLQKRTRFLQRNRRIDIVKPSLIDYLKCNPFVS